MAELSRVFDAGGTTSALYLNVPEFPILPEHWRFGLLAAGGTMVHLLEVEKTPNGWKIGSDGGVTTEHLIQSLVEKGGLSLCIFDAISEGTIFFKTELQIHRTLYENTRDWLKLYAALPYSKPGKLAVFTHAYNEKTILEVFVNHYKGLVPPGSIYIINHGSDPEQIDPFRHLVNVVDIPRGETDHHNISAFCGYFQRFLLTQYDWVIHVDADEMLVYEDGFEQFRSDLQAQFAHSIVRPAHACELIHDIRSEGPIDLAEKISLQRNLLIPNHAFHKPVAAPCATTWTIGFHQCLEPATATMDKLWLIHLRDFDFDRSVERDRKWSALRRSALDLQKIRDTTRPDSGQWKELVLATLAAGESVEMYNTGLGNGRIMAMPDWMRGAF